MITSEKLKAIKDLLECQRPCHGLSLFEMLELIALAEKALRDDAVVKMGRLMSQIPPESVAEMIKRKPHMVLNGVEYFRENGAWWRLEKLTDDNIPPVEAAAQRATERGRDAQEGNHGMD